MYILVIVLGTVFLCWQPRWNLYLEYDLISFQRILSRPATVPQLSNTSKRMKRLCNTGVGQSRLKAWMTPDNITTSQICRAVPTGLYLQSLVEVGDSLGPLGPLEGYYTEFWQEAGRLFSRLSNASHTPSRTGQVQWRCYTPPLTF